jgi:hypothetical protein
MIYPLESALEPVVSAEELLEIESDDEWQIAEVHRCIEEPWYWLVNYVWSIRKDEFTEQPVPLRFPPKEHLRVTFDRCFREPKLVVDKSRQMTLSWLFMAYLLFWAQFHSFEEIVAQTKKEADVEALIWRANFMYESQRSWMRPEATFRSGKGGKLSFPSQKSWILGLPGGVGAGDQIRSKNPSRYFLDEGGFVDEFEDCRTNAEACCQDIKIVSTANPGEFSLLVHDMIGE